MWLRSDFMKVFCNKTQKIHSVTSIPYLCIHLYAHTYIFDCFLVNHYNHEIQTIEKGFMLIECFSVCLESFLRRFLVFVV
jgi:hypothetical protein